jgi:hypothetical protein
MQTRLRLVWTGLALLGIAFAAVDVGALAVPRAAGGSTAAVCPHHHIGDPLEVATRFLASAVERRNLAVSYRLATPSLRGSRSCEEWSSGRLPVTAFPGIDWSRASYQTVAGGEGQVVLRVLLYRAGAVEPVPFLMEIQTEHSEPGWHVGYFARDRWYHPVDASPAA